MMEIHIKSKKCPPTPRKKTQIKSNILFVILSFLELIPFLTYCHWLNVSYQISLNHPLDILDDFIHFSMTYLLHIAEAFQHILCTHNEQQNAKVSVKKWFQNKANIFQSFTFHTSYEARYLSHLLGEKLTHFLLFSSFPPHPSPSLHHFCSYQPQLPQLFQLHRENDHKKYPLKWKKWD